MDDTKALAKEQGYVETVFGRRLYLPEINSPNGPRRAGAERAAINAPMQGTAADLIKLAMIAVQRWIDDAGLAEHVFTRLNYIPEVDVPLYYAGTDLVVLPYRHFDAQSAVGAQVLGHNRPMIVTDCGGLPALVNHEECWIAPPDDPEALADKIGAFLADPPSATQAFAEIAQQAGESMSWQASAEAHWAIYRRLVGRC